MSWDVILFLLGMVLVATWAYSAISAHAATSKEEDNTQMFLRSSDGLDLMQDMKVPEVFDERRMAEDLARLASSPTAVGQYIAQAEIRFTHKQQIKVLERWTERYKAGEAVITARTQMGRAYRDYVHLNAETQIAARKKDVEMAKLDAELEEATLRKQQAKVAQQDLKKKDPPAQPGLTAEQERVLRKSELEREINSLESECAKKMAGLTDEDRRMQIENMYDNRLLELREQLSRHL